MLFSLLPARCKKKQVSYYRPTGRLDPAPADLAYGSLALAALEYQARRGEIIVLYADETILWRFALPRTGWWRTAQRARLPIRPLSQSQIKREEALKRQAWVQYRSGVALLERGRVDRKSINDLPIRSINSSYSEFQAAGRDEYPTPGVAGLLPATLTRVSADAGYPLRRRAV
jgi:hypothetical protein